MICPYCRTILCPGCRVKIDVELVSWDAAKRAVESMKRRQNEDVDEWAKKVAVSWIEAERLGAEGDEEGE